MTTVGSVGGGSDIPVKVLTVHAPCVFFGKFIVNQNNTLFNSK